MVDPENSKLWLDAALREYDTLRREILHYVDNFRRDTTVLGGVLAGAFALRGLPVISDNRLLMIVPSVIFAYFLLQVCNLHMAFVQASACAAIEEKINDRIGGRPMEWESRVATQAVRSPKTPVAIATGVLMIALILLYIGVAVFVAMNIAWWTAAVHLIQLCAMASTFTIYLRAELKSTRGPAAARHLTKKRTI